MNRITDEIFGKQIDSMYCEGLVDAESEKVFIQRLCNKQLPLEKRNLYTCQDGTRIYTVFTHLDYIHLKLKLF